MKIDTDCKFSSGWVRGFKRRNNIVLRKGGSKITRKDDCKLSVIINFIKQVNEKINSNIYSSVINIDETGIYYDSKIDYTLDIKGTKRVEIKTTGREKQRITITLGIDMLNKISMKPLIILKGTTERCISNIPKSDEYELSYQKNAWGDDEQFIKFISFLPTDKKILLLCDNVSSHKTKKVNDYIKKKFPLIDILLLPPNTTSLLQPLDIGTNKPFKTFIKHQYVDWLMEHYDEHKTLPKLIITDRNKLLVEWISKSWKKINFDIIKKSFEFCGYGINENIEPKWKKYYNIEK
jgi:DDE superfamily endonuclease